MFRGFAVFAASALFFLSCASPNTIRPVVYTDELAEEMVNQRYPQYLKKKTLEKRLQRIAESILWANSELCGENTKDRYGFFYIDKKYISDIKMDVVDKKLLMKYHNLSSIKQKPTIIGVVKNSPADVSGMKTGDVIVAINDNPVIAVTEIRRKVVSASNAATTTIKEKSNFLELLNESHDDSVTISVIRNQATIEIRMKSQSTCSYGIVMLEDGSVNAWTDGKLIYIPTGMLAFTSDQELALVISHEMAHCTEGHIKKKKTNALAGMTVGMILGAIVDVGMASAFGGPVYTSNTNTMGQAGGLAGASAFSQAFEEEADYIGVYFMARAGYKLDRVSEFWRRIAKNDPEKSNSFSGSHPPSAKRFLLIEKTIAEVSLKKRNKEKLIPNMVKHVIKD